MPRPERRFPSGVLRRFYRLSVSLRRCSSDGGCYDSRMRALVTGGTGRVGSAIATRLGLSGYQVFAAGRVHGDLASPEAAAAVVERAVEELGGLDLLVHAASNGFAPKPVAEVTEADWDAAFGATAKGAFFVSQAAAPHLRSVARDDRDDRGRRRLPAVAALRRPLRGEVGPGDAHPRARPRPRPGGPRLRGRSRARSPSTPGRRNGGRPRHCWTVGDPEDVADAVLYLAGADFVTGTTPRRRRRQAPANRAERACVTVKTSMEYVVSASFSATRAGRRACKLCCRDLSRESDGDLLTRVACRRPRRVRACCTAATRARSSAWPCAGSATASGRRTPCRRRSRRSGARRAATGGNAVRAGPGCSRSRGTRSSTGSATGGPSPSREIRPRSQIAGRGPDEQAETGWLAWRVHRALEELPQGERAVLELAYWGGLSQSEVADVSQRPARHGEDAHPHGLCRGSRTCSRRTSSMTGPRLRRSRRRRGAG